MRLSKKTAALTLLAAFLAGTILKAVIDDRPGDYSEAELQTIRRNVAEKLFETLQYGGTLHYQTSAGQDVRVELLPYNSVDELLALNPDDFHFGYRGPEGYLPPFVERWWYEDAGVATFSHTKRPRDQSIHLQYPKSAGAFPINRDLEPIDAVLTGYD